MSSRVKFLEEISTYLEKYEQWVLDDIGEVHLDEPSVLSNVKLYCDQVLTLMDCTRVSSPAIRPTH